MLTQLFSQRETEVAAAYAAYVRRMRMDEPTPEMMVAGANVLDATNQFDWRDTALLAEEVYKAMIAAKRSTP